EDSTFVVRRALEIGNDSSSNNASLRKEERKLTQTISLLKNETALLRQRIRNAKNEVASLTPPNSSCDEEIITAPFSASVFLLKHRSNEFAKKGETIVILANNNRAVHINAQFESKSQRYLKYGALVEVELDDGWSTQGVITEIYSSVFDDDKQLLNKDPDKFKIWARILPSDEASRQRWLANDLMGVNVRGRK
ncbi:MAG: hypothetical protein OEL79_09605, partial [Chromatiales bacterium]|nr:hypothetical protein [Chromatiales bacterium]